MTQEEMEHIAGRSARPEALDRALQFHRDHPRWEWTKEYGYRAARTLDDEVLATATKFERYLSGRGSE